MKRGPGPDPKVRVVLVGVLDLAPEVWLYVQGSGAFPWGARPTIGILECTSFPGHVATLEPST
jgi:hypothetical protein